MKLNLWKAVAVLVVLLIGLVSWAVYTEYILPVVCVQPASRIEVRNTTSTNITQYGERGMLEVANLTEGPLHIERTGGFPPSEYQKALPAGESEVIPCGRGRIITIR